LQIDTENLKLKLYPEIYIAGDILESFWDRTSTNCFIQASIISHNIKIDEFKLRNSKKVSYSPIEKLCHIHSYNKLMIASNKQIKFEKLSWFKNMVFEKSCIIPESPLCRKLYFEKMLGIKLDFKLK